jgi:hypothetical protein
MVSATTARRIRICSRANVASCADGQKDPTLRRRREATRIPSSAMRPMRALPRSKGHGFKPKGAALLE